MMRFEAPRQHNRRRNDDDRHGGGNNGQWGNDGGGGGGGGGSGDKYGVDGYDPRFGNIGSRGPGVDGSNYSGDFGKMNFLLLIFFFAQLQYEEFS